MHSETTSRLCTVCRHPIALHGNGKTACKAMGCKAGPDNTPCPHYTVAEHSTPAAV